MEIEITNTIQAVDEDQWNALVEPGFIEQSYRWYKTIEESGMIKMHYIFAKEKGRLTAAACCFPYRHRLRSIPLEIPTLQVKTPLGTSKAFYSPTPEHTYMLREGLKEIMEREKVKRVAVLGFREKEFATAKDTLNGFIPLPPFADTYIDLDFADFDDYLSSLDASARRSIRKTLNRSEKRWKIKPVITTEFSAWKRAARTLQGYICRERNDYRMYLTEQFYEALERNLKDTAELMFLFKDDNPLVFGLSVNSPTISQHKAVGVDPHYREYQAYFLLYYEGIKRALERRQKRIYFGLTTYSFKEKIGCKREHLYWLAKLDNPLFDLALKSYMALYRLSGAKE